MQLVKWSHEQFPLTMHSGWLQELRRRGGIHIRRTDALGNRLQCGQGEEDCHPSISLADAVLALYNVNLLPEDVGSSNLVQALLAHTELANRFNSSGRGRGHGNGGRRGYGRRGGRNINKRDWRKKCNRKKEDESVSDHDVEENPEELN